MDDINYKIGALENQVNTVVKQNEQMAKDIAEIKKEVNEWRNRATGAVGVLSFAGVVILYLGHDLLKLIMTKLGF